MRTMVDDIRKNKQFQNLGIDVNAIATMNDKQDIEQTPQATQEVPDQHSSIKKEILTITHNQLVDLARQFKEYADATDQRIEKLDNQLRNLMKRENQRELTTEQQTIEQPPKETFDSGDVSISKMFNFANTHGDKNPRPVR